MLRGIGGSLGTAIFGTIFSTRLADQLRGNLHGSLGEEASRGVRLTGAQVARLPGHERGIYQHAYVHALSPVFIVAAGVVALGIALSLLIQQRPLRSAAATSTGLEDSLAAPRSPDSLAEVERALSQVTTAEQREAFRARLVERAHVDLSPGAVWALVRIDEHGFTRARALALEDGVPQERIEQVLAELSANGLMARNGEGLELTPAGHEHTARLVQARRELLVEALADDSAERDSALTELLYRLARELCGEPPVAERSRVTAAT
jgi:predicted MarR family transcription regulator